LRLARHTKPIEWQARPEDVDSDRGDHHCYDALRIWLDPKGSSMLYIEGQRTVNVHDTLTVLKSV